MAGVVGLLLCGGRGTRFGGDKLMAGDPPIAVRAARTLRGALPRVLAVVPLGADRLQRALEEAGCEVLATDRTQRGMGASLAAGIEASASASGWIVALGDMPAVSAATVASLAKTLAEEATLAAPFDAEGRRGHPVAFSASLRDELLALDGDVGARHVLQAHADAIWRLQVDDPGIFVDVDTRGDLEALG